LLNKFGKTNKSTVQGKEVDEKDKKSIIDEEKVLVPPQRNTAEVIKESRKEPALPQEGIVGQLPDKEQKLAEGQKFVARQKLVEGQKPVDGQKPVEGQKLVEGQKHVVGQKPVEGQDTVLRHADKKLLQQADANLNSKDTDLRNQPTEGDLKHLLDTKHQNAEPKQNERLRRVPDQEALKPHEEVLKKKESEEKDRALNDEVRVAGERKILTNGDNDVASDLKTNTAQSKINASTTDENKLIIDKDQPLEKDTSQNIVRNKTIVNVNTETIERDTKPLSRSIKDETTDNSETRNDSIKSSRNIRAPLLKRLFKQSRRKLRQR
jgi:hypothetical protein